MSRFDYVEYDGSARIDQASFKNMVVLLEANINATLDHGRYRALAITALEETYMWIGKAIRDNQLERNADTKSQEQRSNS